MKKKLLFLPLIGLLLSGCSFDDLMFWKKSNESTQKDEEKNTDGNKTDDGGNKDDEEQQPSDGEEEQISPQEIGDEEYSGTVLTSGENFSIKFPSGSHFDTSSKVETLTNHVKGQLKYTNLVKSISCTNLHTLAFEDVTYLEFGSGNGSGALAFESDVKIYKVEVKVLCYAKYDSYHKITNIDSWSHFLINDQDNDMTYDGKTNPSVMTFEKSFEEGVNSFTLASKDGRVFMKEMSITWRG